MKRRNFFAILFAPLLARGRPRWGLGLAKSPVLDELNAYTLKHITPAITDNIYAQSPICMRLHGRQYFDNEPTGDYMGIERTGFDTLTFRGMRIVTDPRMKPGEVLMVGRHNSVVVTNAD